jgi:hypothetical protein
MAKAHFSDFIKFDGCANLMVTEKMKVLGRVLCEDC